jgi:universal stress protein A
MFAPKNILVPTDFSKYSDMALKTAIDIATRYNSKIYLLHVIDQQFQECASDYCISNDVAKMIKKESMKASKENLNNEADRIAKGKKIKVAFDVKAGIPAEVILSEQKTKKIDLIVISSHGRTGILKQFMGSIADKVIKGAKCPVTVVKP